MRGLPEAGNRCPPTLGPQHAVYAVATIDDPASVSALTVRLCPRDVKVRCGRVRYGSALRRFALTITAPCACDRVLVTVCCDRVL